MSETNIAPKPEKKPIIFSGIQPSGTPEASKWVATCSGREGKRSSPGRMGSRHTADVRGQSQILCKLHLGCE